MSHVFTTGSTAATALRTLTECVLTLPASKRGAAVQAVVSFRTGLTISECLDAGPIRAAFADYWEATTGQSIPIRELRAALEPPIPIGIVLEFSKLNFARSHDETAEALAGLVSHLSSRIVKLRPSPQLHLFDARTKGQVDAAPPGLACGTTVLSLSELVATGTKFPTIYADPPWAYDNEASRAAAANHYKTMSLDEICREPVRELADDNAHLHLWTTNGFLRQAFDVIDAWGFKFKSCLVWVKDEIGMGNYWRVSHEFLLLGVRGRLTFRDRSISSWVNAPRTDHSRKPGVVRALIERVSPGPYLELYGREELPGSAWTVYGNQIERRLF